MHLTSFVPVLLILPSVSLPFVYYKLYMPMSKELVLEKYKEDKKHSPQDQTMSDMLFVPVFRCCHLLFSFLSHISYITTYKCNLVSKKWRKKKKAHHGHEWCVWCHLCPFSLTLHSLSLPSKVFIMPLWFLPESGHSCGILWILAELLLAEPPAKITIPELGLEWSRNGPEQNPVECILLA